MKERLAALNKLGFSRRLYYLLFYPFSTFRKRIDNIDEIHEELRWIKQTNHYLNLLGKENISKLDSQFTEEIRAYYNPVSDFINLDDYRVFEHFTGLQRKEFIPHYIFHRHIMPVLNPADSNVLFLDKNNFSRIFRDFKQPDTVLRYTHGRFYDSDYQPAATDRVRQLLLNYESDWIIKPSRLSNSGTDVFAGKSEGGQIWLNGSACTLTDLEKKYRYGFIIQEKIRQSEVLAAFHSESLNTLRVFTLRLGSEIVTLPATYLRCGVSGNHVDNMGSGGVGCGVQSNGDLREKGIDVNLNPVYNHPDSGIRFSGQNLDFYKDICQFAKAMHQVTPQIDLAAWDISVDEKEEPVFIEVNTRHPNSWNPQLLNGPFFGEYTDTVLDYTIRRNEL